MPGLRLGAIKAKCCLGFTNNEDLTNGAIGEIEWWRTSDSTEKKSLLSAASGTSAEYFHSSFIFGTSGQLFQCRQLSSYLLLHTNDQGSQESEQ